MTANSDPDSPATGTAGVLAINGGKNGFRGRIGKTEPMVDVEAFLYFAERLRFSQAVSNDDLGHGSYLGRYSRSSQPSMGDRFEALAREYFNVKHA